ncbi:MAG TPA: VOC family protein [Candidatus Binataceae bacterium]|nr:VOC family protein [Candidatus Binataceae bacterium]
MVKGINHVAIVVSDVDRSRKFYEKLGMAKIPRPKVNVPGEWMGIGENQLHIVGERAPEGRIDPRRPHMALAVDDIEAAKKSLREAGINFVEPAARQDVIPMNEEVLRLVGRQIWLEDPDGNMIELREEYKG